MDMSAALNRIEEEIRKSPYHRGVFDSSCEGGKLNPRTEGHGGRRRRGAGREGLRVTRGVGYGLAHLGETAALRRVWVVDVDF
jgi:hypothetical protein